MKLILNTKRIVYTRCNGEEKMLIEIEENKTKNINKMKKDSTKVCSLENIHGEKLNWELSPEMIIEEDKKEKQNIMNLFENLKVYDFERNQICNVMSIITSNLNDRKLGDVEINNGYVTFYKNHLLKECIILPWTGQKDSEKEFIYCDDLLENDEIIFRVKWHQQQACWWLTPVKIKNPKHLVDDNFLLVLDNQSLGNGYFSRKDLKKIGNWWTSKERNELEIFPINIKS